MSRLAHDPDRVRLAEAMFPDHEFKRNVFKEPIMAAGGRWDRQSAISAVPDPFTDANDCEALMQWLNERGYHVEIHWQAIDPTWAAGAWIHIWHKDTEAHHRQDIDLDRWKQGVCERALNVLDLDLGGLDRDRSKT